MNMAKILCGLIIFSLAMTIAAECLVCSTKKFNCVERGMRFIGGVIMQFSKISLLECAVECSKNAQCKSFQFTAPSPETQSESACLFLDLYEESPLTARDSQSNIYQLDSGSDSAKTEALTTATTPTTASSTTTATTTKTTTTPSTTTTTKVSQTTTPVPASRNPKIVCNYANEPVNVSCNCTTTDFCSGIMQCNATIFGSAVSYYLDRTTVSNYSGADQACKKLNMGLITVETKVEQSTICLILTQAVGNLVTEGFWMGLTRTNDTGNIGNSNWVYADGSSLGTYRSWYLLDSYPGLCGTIAGGSSNFTWDPFACNPSSGAKKMRTLCTRVVV